jgi:quinol-cytochrome oxidoreductase complex cytochrome b subunit
VTDTTIKIGDFTINGAFVGGVVVPGVLILLLALWPYFDRSSVNSVGVWFAGERRTQNTVFLITFAIVLILTIIGTFMRGPSWRFYWPWEAWPQVPTRY